MVPRLRAAAGVAAVTNFLAAVGMGALARGTPIVVDPAQRLAFIQSHLAAWRVGWVMWIPTAIALALFYRELARTLTTPWRFAWLAAALSAVADVSLLHLMLVGVPSATPASLPAFERMYELGAGLGVNSAYSIAGLILNVCCLRADTIPRKLAWFGMIIWPCGLTLSAASLLHLPMVAAVSGAATLLSFSAWCAAIALRR